MLQLHPVYLVYFQLHPVLPFLLQPVVLSPPLLLQAQPSVKLQREPPESGVQTTQLGRNLGIILSWQSRLFRIALNISVFGLEIN